MHHGNTKNHDGSIIKIFIPEENRNLIKEAGEKKILCLSFFRFFWEKQQLVRSEFPLFPLLSEITCTCAQCLSDFLSFYSPFLLLMLSVFMHKVSKPNTHLRTLEKTIYWRLLIWFRWRNESSFFRSVWKLKHSVWISQRSFSSALI